jgi:hypothetical protein
MNELVERLEAIESMLNEDNPNISDIRIDVALLLNDLTSDEFSERLVHKFEDDSIGVEISSNNVQINGC